MIRRGCYGIVIPNWKLKKTSSAIWAFVLLGLFAACGPAEQGGITQSRESNFVGGNDVPEATIELIDLNQQVAAIQDRTAEQADTSLTYYASTQSTVHMHVLARKQITPLHIHKQADELTVVVAGQPKVTQWNVQGTNTVPSENRFDQFALIASPTYCGHEWENDSSSAVQANLVFALPTFNGNFYVRPDDPELARCEGSTANSLQELRQLANASAGNTVLEPAASMHFGSRFQYHFNTEEFLLDTSASAAIVLFVGGTGFLQTNPPTQVSPGQLLLIPAGYGLTIAPANNQSVEFYSYLPELP